MCGSYSVVVVSTVVWWFPLRVMSVKVSNLLSIFVFESFEGGKNYDGLSFV